MRTLFCLILLAMIFMACKKDKDISNLPIWNAGPKNTGWGTAVRDGDAWQSTANAVHHYGDSSNYIGLYFHTYTNDGFLREELLLNEIPLKLGKYPLRGHISEIYDGNVGSVYGFMEDDGDVFGATYNPDDSEGVFELTKLDTANNVVAGTFSRIVFKNRTPDSPYPQAVIFENGKFEMMITE